MPPVDGGVVEGAGNVVDGGAVGEVDSLPDGGRGVDCGGGVKSNGSAGTELRGTVLSVL